MAYGLICTLRLGSVTEPRLKKLRKHKRNRTGKLIAKEKQMSIFEDFWYDAVQPIFYQLQHTKELQTKYVDWDHVDGEEGDTGVIEYYYDQQLVATKVVLGGDEEWTVFTQYGKQMCVDLLMKKLQEIAAEPVSGLEDALSRLKKVRGQD